MLRQIFSPRTEVLSLGKASGPPSSLSPCHFCDQLACLYVIFICETVYCLLSNQSQWQSTALPQRSISFSFLHSSLSNILKTPVRPWYSCVLKLAIFWNNVPTPFCAWPGPSLLPSPYFSYSGLLSAQNMLQVFHAFTCAPASGMFVPLLFPCLTSHPLGSS